MVPVNKEWLTWPVPVNKELLTGTVPVNNNIIFIENNYFLSLCLQFGSHQIMFHLGSHLYHYVLILISHIFVRAFRTSKLVGQPLGQQSGPQWCVDCVDLWHELIAKRHLEVLGVSIPGDSVPGMNISQNLCIFQPGKVSNLCGFWEEFPNFALPGFVTKSDWFLANLGNI